MSQQGAKVRRLHSRQRERALGDCCGETASHPTQLESHEYNTLRDTAKEVSSRSYNHERSFGKEMESIRGFKQETDLKTLSGDPVEKGQLQYVYRLETRKSVWRLLQEPRELVRA